MARFVPLQSAAEQIRASGASFDGYLWNPRQRGPRWNLMVISDRLSPSKSDPFLRGTKTRFGTRGAREVLRYKTGVLVRHGRLDLRKLAAFLKGLLLTLHYSRILAITYNEDANRLSPEPWAAFLSGKRRARFNRTVWHKFKLDVRPRTRRPVMCSLPEDRNLICALAMEFWQMYARNLYLFLPDGTRIVICHERDLHVCTRNRGVMRWVRKSANRVGLSIAPIAIQQCV